jgi:hypothetical protein
MTGDYKTGDILQHSIMGLGVVVKTFVDGAYYKNVVIVHWLNEGKEETVWQWSLAVQPVVRVK